VGHSSLIVSYLLFFHIAFTGEVLYAHSVHCGHLWLEAVRRYTPKKPVFLRAVYSTVHLYVVLS